VADPGGAAFYVVAHTPPKRDESAEANIPPRKSQPNLPRRILLMGGVGSLVHLGDPLASRFALDPAGNPAAAWPRAYFRKKFPRRIFRCTGRI